MSQRRPAIDPLVPALEGESDPDARPARVAPFADFDALRAAVLDRHAALPRRLAQAGRYALDNPDEVALGTVGEVAARAGVTPSTLVRFAQTIGFAGFSDMQEVFRTRLRARPAQAARLDARASGGEAAQDAPLALLDSFVEGAVSSVMHLRETIRPADLARAVAVLAAADTIFLLGQRRAFPVATCLAYACGRLGLRAVLLDNLGAMLPEQAAGIAPRDALLVTSFTPYTPSTIETTTLLARRGVPIVAITDSAFSPIAPFAASWLEVAEADQGAFRSLAASLSLAMTLAVAVSQMRGGG